MKNKKLIWRLTCAAVVVISALSFSPVVIPVGKFQPELLGMPYTLWMGIIASVLLVLLTFVGTKVHPGQWDETQEAE